MSKENKGNKTAFLLTLFPNIVDHEELTINGYVLLKSRHGDTNQLQVYVYTEESRRRMNPGMF